MPSAFGFGLRSLRRMVGVLVVPTLLAAFAARPAHAQTPVAQFDYAQSTVGSGLNEPTGVAVDNEGNLYIADPGNGTVVKETLSGGGYTQSTVASGLSDPAGVAVDSAGNLYVAVAGDGVSNGVLLKETPSGETYTQSTLASGLNEPTGVAVDSAGNLYVVIAASSTFSEFAPIVKFVRSGNTYTEQSDLFPDSLNMEEPFGVAVGSNGDVYVSVQADPAIIIFQPSGNSYTEYDFLPGRFQDPTGLAMDGAGNLYVADAGANTVVELAGPNFSSTKNTFAGNLNGPGGVAVDIHGNLYVADIDNGRVVEYAKQSADFGTEPIGVTSATQTLTFTFNSSVTLGAPETMMMGAKGQDFVVAPGGSCTSGASFSAGDTCTVNVTFTPTVAGAIKGAVNLTNSTGAVTATAYVYGTGQGPQVVFDNTPATGDPTVTVGGGFNFPEGVAVDGSDNVLVADSENNAVKEIPVGCTAASCVETLGGGFSEPAGVAVDGGGNVFVADSENNAVKEIPVGCTAASCVETLGGGFSEPGAVAVDGSGNVFVADQGNNAVKEIPTSCIAGANNASCVVTLGGGFSSPVGVAVDAFGNVLVADTSNNAVKEIPTSCIAGANNASCVKTLGGGFRNPFDVAVDGSGNVFVADVSNNAVKEIPVGCTAASCVVTLGGGFRSPGGVAVDAFGNVLVADSVNNAVKVIIRAAPPALSFPSTNVGATSSPLAVTVTNIGNEPLTFPIPTAAGTYNPSVTTSNPSGATDFTYDNSSTCLQNGASAATPFTLAAGTSCTAAIDFAPTTAGAITGNAVLTDDSLGFAAPNNTQTIKLSGTGVLPVTQLEFGVGSIFPLSVGANGGSITVDEMDSTGVTVTTATDAITLTVTGPGGYSKTYTETAVAGVATFDLSSVILKTAGTYTYTATSGSISTAAYTFNTKAGAASTITAVSGGGFSTAINTAFPENLVVKVTDQYGNPVAGATVVFTAPTSGASATLSAAAATDSNGETHVTATANGIGSATPYTVTASVAGVSGTATFSLTNTGTPATVTLGGLAETYTGSPISATATTDPAGLAVSFTYNGSATAPTQAGSYTVVATINDPTHTGTATGTLVIAKATPVATWAAPASITYGTAVSATQLNATATFNGQPVAGTFGYSVPQGEVLAPGNYNITATFTPTDTTDFNLAFADQSLYVGPAAVTVTTPPTASTIVYGQALSASILTGGAATANGAAVAGAFAWTNTATMPGAGTTSYAVTFTPTNTTDYNAATVMVAVTVKQADLAVAVANATRAYGAANPALTGAVTGLVNGDTAASVGLVYSTTATTASAPGSYPITATITSPNYSLTVTPGTLTVTAPGLTVTATNATRVYGAANPTFTGTVTGAVNGDMFTESFTTTATPTSNVGSYAIVPAVAGANLANYSPKMVNGTLTITQAATTTALSAGASSLTPGQNLTLTAKVADATSGSVGTPSGAVTFFDGATQLGTAALTNGAASFTVSTLASGTHSFTASYGGDVNFQPSTSTAPVSVPVENLTFSLDLTGGQGQTVVPGSPAGYTFAVTPTYGAYPGVVSFTATGLPAGATATFAPATIPANGGAQTVTMTIQTAPPATAAQNHKSSPFRRGGEVALGFLLVPFLGLRKRKRWMKMLSIVLLIVGMGAITGLVSGCGSSGFFGQQQKSYQVTVTATSGTVSQSSVVTLNVE